MNKLEETARYWQGQGVATIPIHWKSKSPEVKTWTPYTGRLPNDEELDRWYITDHHNIGVVAGWQNLCILDFDTVDKYTSWIYWAEHNSTVAATVLLTSRIVMSARGVHLYFYTRERGRNMKLEGVDVLCDRKYALTAPSIHPSGVSYSVLQDNTPVRIQSIDQMIPPEWIQQEETKLLQQAAEAPIRKTEWSADYLGPIEKIKQHYRIEDFFPDAIPSGGNWYKVSCPLHEDRHPSAGINIEQQIFTCFTHCYGRKPLDVIGLYAKMHGISENDAIREMIKPL